MTVEERSAGLAAAARVCRDRLLALADDALQGSDVELVTPPEPSSIMMEFESGVGAFCFTEVVVTTASVRLAGAAGWGYVMGFDREGALAAAVLDADSTQAVERLVRAALAAEREERERLARELSRTRV
jgi:alpha-D-ribose 1-methylphosphonate 5-triphosphate synthase subunit PhnG